jgi:hypothetical protein
MGVSLVSMVEVGHIEATLDTGQLHGESEVVAFDWLAIC